MHDMNIIYQIYMLSYIAQMFTTYMYTLIFSAGEKVTQTVTALPQNKHILFP